MDNGEEPKLFQRDFILTFFSHFTFASVFHILIPTLPIYLKRLGSTEIEIGLLIGIFAISSLGLRPLVGKALLKTMEKRFMIGGSVLYALTSIAYLFTPPFWPFFIVRVFQGIAFAFFHTASLTLIANISSESHRGQSLGYFSISMTISGALSPSIGFIINNFSFATLFLVCFGLSVCSMVISLQLKGKRPSPSEDHSIRRIFFLSREALPPSIINSFSLFIWGALTAFFPLYAINHGVSNPGLFFTTIALMLILGRVFGGRIMDLYDREKVILPCLICYIVSMSILSFSKTLPMFILVAVIFGMGQAFLMPVLVAYALTRDGTSAGPVMGTFTAVSDLGLFLGSVIMGIVIQTTGYSTMFLCLAILGFINLNYFYFFVRKRK